MRIFTEEERNAHEEQFQENLACYQSHFRDDGFLIDPVLIDGYVPVKHFTSLSIKNLIFRIKQSLGMDKPFKV